MDKAKIAKLCNEIEDIACDISQQTMNDIVSAESRMIFDKVKEIAAEITAPPKSNADRVRQMTDEELAELIANENDFCSLCAYKSDAMCYKQPTACTHGFYEWLQKEVSEDAAD
jgi:hypothetical protein